MKKHCNSTFQSKFSVRKIATYIICTLHGKMYTLQGLFNEHVATGFTTSKNWKLVVKVTIRTCLNYILNYILLPSYTILLLKYPMCYFLSSGVFMDNLHRKTIQKILVKRKTRPKGLVVSFSRKLCQKILSIP